MPPLRKKRNRRVFAWLADTHGGKRTGLLNPNTVLIRVHDDGSIEEWTPELSQTQRQLWPIFMWAIGELKEYAKDDEIIVGHNGDITHGDRYGDFIPETTREDQRIIAHDNLLPLLEMPNVNKGLFLTGTEVHVPECSEARVAARLMSTTGKKIHCANHGRFEVDNEIIDAAHHGPHPGTRKWTRGNVARLYLKDRVEEDKDIDLKPARIYMRAHYHRFVHETINSMWQGEYTIHDVVVVPALSGLDGFTYKVGKSPPLIQAGMVALEFVGGRLCEIKPFVRSIDLRVNVKL